MMQKILYDLILPLLTLHCYLFSICLTSMIYRYYLSKTPIQGPQGGLHLHSYNVARAIVSMKNFMPMKMMCKMCSFLHTQRSFACWSFVGSDRKGTIYRKVHAYVLCLCTEIDLKKKSASKPSCIVQTLVYSSGQTHRQAKVNIFQHYTGNHYHYFTLYSFEF